MKSGYLFDCPSTLFFISRRRIDDRHLAIHQACLISTSSLCFPSSFKKVQGKRRNVKDFAYTIFFLSFHLCPYFDFLLFWDPLTSKWLSSSRNLGWGWGLRVRENMCIQIPSSAKFHLPNHLQLPNSPLVLLSVIFSIRCYWKANYLTNTLHFTTLHYLLSLIHI